MDVEVSPPSVDQSFENVEEPSSKIDEPEVGEEEEDQFYDAGENAAHNSSDVTPSDLNFSVANEDLPTDGSDHSAQNTPTPAPRQKRNIERTLNNLDDISTEGPSSVDGSNSPVDDGRLIEGSITALSSTSEHNTDAVSQPSSTDTVHQYSAADDFSQHKADVSNENVPSHDDNSINDSKSSMEVMEDESDSHSSKRNTPEKVVPTDANENADVSTGVDSSTENGSKLISETATLDSALTDKKVVSETNEILTMDDSDVDESLQENLDVAIKVVEESESSAVRTSTTDEPESSAKIDDATNDEDLLKESSFKSENILEEFQEDAAKINGDSSEILDSRLCPCRVVLFRIDFDENAVKYLKHQTETVQSSSDGNFDSSLDSSFSTPTKLSPPKRRVLTKAARKMIPPPESSKTPSPRARNVRTPATTESARPRRNTRNTSAQDCKPAYSDSVNSDDEAAPANISRKRKAVANTTRLAGRPRKTPSYPERTSRRNDVDETEIIENELSVDLSSARTLKCVSIPIITDIVNLLGEKTCSELMTLIEQKENILPSRITKSKLPKSTTTARSSRRRKQSPSDTSKFSVEDDDCKTSGKMGRYDIGTSTEESSSLRSEAKSSNKRSCRQNARVRNYAEDSDESPLKKATTSRRNLTRSGRNEKRVIDSDDENAEDSPKAKSVSNKRSSRVRTKVRNYLETSKSDDEAALKEETSRENSSRADDNEKNNSDSDEEKTEDLPKVKSTSNKRSSRKSAKVRNSESDNSPLKKETSNENSIDVARSEQNDTDTDDKKGDLPKSKSTTNKRTSRKRANIQYHTEDSKSDDESQLKVKRSRRNSNRTKRNEKNDTDSDDEKVEDSPKMKSTSSRRSSRKSTKVQNYVEDSENDDESPLKEKKSRETLTPLKRDEKNDTDSDDNNAEDLPKLKSTSSKGTSKKSLKVQDRFEDSKSDDESSSKEETTEENSTHTESSEKQVTGSDDQNAEDSAYSRFWRSVEAQNDVKDSQSDNKSPLEKEETSRRNSSQQESSVKNDTSSDDENAEDSPEAKSTSNKRSSRESSKVRKYVGESESDDEVSSKKTKTSRRNSIYTDSEDEKAQDSSSEIENRSSWKKNGLSSSKTRTRT